MAKLEDYKASSKSGAWSRVPKEDRSSTVRSMRKYMEKTARGIAISKRCK